MAQLIVGVKKMKLIAAMHAQVLPIYASLAVYIHTAHAMMTTTCVMTEDACIMTNYVMENRTVRQPMMS